jgi:hypothetical protein
MYVNCENNSIYVNNDIFEYNNKNKK